MSKLSTIDDVEQRAQQPAAPEPEQDLSAQATKKRVAADIDMTAEQEEEFHGLDTQQPMSLGHKSLIIVAVVVLVVAILYIVNSWMHFV